MFVQTSSTNMERDGKNVVSMFEQVNSMIPPDEPPEWVKMQFMPHLDKQTSRLAQVRAQIEELQVTDRYSVVEQSVPEMPETTEVLEAVRSAPSCTKSADKPKTCSCGLVPPKDARFCDRCGRALQ